MQDGMSDIKNVISDFLNEEGLVSHLIDSFDEFIQHGILSTLNELVEIVSENEERIHIIRVINVVVEAPCFSNANGAIEECLQSNTSIYRISRSMRREFGVASYLLCLVRGR